MMEKYKKDRPCKKCGSVGTTDKYISRVKTERKPEITKPLAILLYEYIERYCVNCSYIWKEEVLVPEEIDNHK